MSGPTSVRVPEDAVAAERRAREAAERHADRMRRLAEVATALSSALTARDVARVVVDQTSAEIEADFGGVWLLDDGHARLELVAERGMLPSMRAGVASYALSTANPLCVAVQTAEPVWLESWEDYARRFPLSEQRVRDIKAPRPQAFCCLPLRIGEQLLGGLAFSFMRPHHFSDDDRAFISLLAHHCAQGMERARLYERAVEAVRVRDDFLSVAGHELRTPLGTLLLQVQMLIEDPPSGPDPERYAPVVRTLGRLIKLADEVMDISRLRGGRLHLEPEPMDLCTLVRDVVGRQLAARRRRLPEIRLHADQPIEGCWDSMRLEQVVTNLVTNACKYGGDQPVDVEVGRHPEGVQIVVRDRGMGIGRADQARIFERFERAVSTQSYAGLGLGLWIAREVVEAHGGHITVLSEAGQGAEFKVVLPLRTPTPEATAETRGA
jgi:signal transduction histidine kinase